MKRLTKFPVLAPALLSMAITSATVAQADNLVYPKAPADNTVDEYFGIKVPDPYRPLENDTAMSTLEWVKAENAVTNGYLSKIPFRNALRNEIE